MPDSHDDADDRAATSTNDAEVLAQAVYDPTEWHDLTSAIVYTIADAKAVSPRELDSRVLHDVVDVEAVEAVFFDPERSRDLSSISNRIAFEYETYRVEVWNDGEILVFGQEPPNE